MNDIENRLTEGLFGIRRAEVEAREAMHAVWAMRGTTPFNVPVDVDQSVVKFFVKKSFKYTAIRRSTAS